MDRNTERSRRELGIPLHTKVVAFVGRLQQFKGPEVLIRATAELFRRQHAVPVLGDPVEDPGNTGAAHSLFAGEHYLHPGVL